MCSNSRENTHKRWSDALKRAIDEELAVFEQVGGDEFLVMSSSIPNAAYLVTKYWCSCEAAKHGDPVCKHRALVIHNLGEKPYVPVSPTNELELLLATPSIRITGVTSLYGKVLVEVEKRYEDDTYRRVTRSGRTVLDATRNAIAEVEAKGK